MRSEEVKKALQFLRSPQLAAVPLSEQIQFLEQKVRKILVSDSAAFGARVNDVASSLQGLTAEEVASVLSQLTSSGLGAAIA